MRDYIQRAPRGIVWGGYFVASLGLVLVANAVQRQVNPLLLAVPFGLLILAALWLLFAHGKSTPLEPIGATPTQLRWIALAVFGVAFALSLWIAWGFGANAMGDSGSYVRFGRELFDLGKPIQTVWLSETTDYRTFPYLLLNWLTNSFSSPTLLLIAQGAISAAAVALMAVVLAARDRVTGILAGLLLAFDPVRMAADRTVMSESVAISGLVIVLALMLHQIERGRRVPRWSLIGAGALFGFALLARPSNLGLLPFILLAYGVAHRSLRHALWVLLGAALMLVALSGFNAVRYGSPALFTNGTANLGGPLMRYRLFDPANGPASVALDERIKACHPEIDAEWGGDSAAYLDEARGMPYTIHYISIQCNWTIAERAIEFQEAFTEAVRADPLRYIQILIEENTAVLTFSMLRYNALQTSKQVRLFSFNEDVNTRGINQCDAPWCNLPNPPANPLSTESPVFQLAVPLMGALRQPYLLVAEPNVPARQNWLTRGMQDIVYDSYCSGEQPCVSLSVYVAWMLWVGFALITARGRMQRYLVVSVFATATLLIGAITVTYLFEPRYGAPFSSLFLLLTAVTLGSVLHAFRIR